MPPKRKYSINRNERKTSRHLLNRAILFFGSLLLLFAISFFSLQFYQNNIVKILQSRDEREILSFVAEVRNISERAQEQIGRALSGIQEEKILSADKSQEAIRTGLEVSRQAARELSALAGKVPRTRDKEAMRILGENCKNIAWAFSFQEELYTALLYPNEEDTDEELIEHILSNTKKMNILIAHSLKNVTGTQRAVKME